MIAEHALTCLQGWALTLSAIRHPYISRCMLFICDAIAVKRDEGLNQKPKSFNQEIPRKLRDLGIAIKDVKEGRLGKKSKNKYLKKPDAPKKDDVFTVKEDTVEKKKETDQDSSNFKADLDTGASQQREKKVGKRKQQMTSEAMDEYISNLKPTRPLVESFNFKKKKDESQKAFMRRVNEETERVVKKSTIADRFDVSDKKKIETLIHKKMSRKPETAKEKLKSRKKRKAEARREKEYDEFEALKDKVEFGDVVHAPPSLSVLPKKAVAVGYDRPGLRMPELKEAFASKSPEAVPDKFDKCTKSVVREKGKTVKRKHLSAFHQKESDAAREDFISAYRQMKSKKSRLKQ